MGEILRCPTCETTINASIVEFPGGSWGLTTCQCCGSPVVLLRSVTYRVFLPVEAGKDGE
jgi:hypothetical protein